MKYFLVLIILASCSLNGRTQNVLYPFPQLYQLDSIGQSNSIASHFGELYFVFLQSIEHQLTTADTTRQQLVRRFEQVFAQFFIDASYAHQQQQQIAIRDWENYFSHSGLQPVQYKLLGANAHLNGGLWQALSNSFTMDEMKILTEQFLIFNKSLNKAYKAIYREAISTNKRAADLHKLTLGVNELVGNFYLYKWRKRQMKLARLYWSGSPQFAPLLARINRKKSKIDKLIIQMH